MEYFTLNLSKVGLDTSLNSWLREQPSLLRKRLRKKKEKEEKEKGERGKLIFQAWFEYLKYFTGCNFHPRSL